MQGVFSSASDGGSTRSPRTELRFRELTDTWLFCYVLHAHPISRESPRTSNTILDSHVHGSRKKSEWMHLELAEITVYRPNGATTTAPPGPIARIQVETWQALLRAAGRSRVTTQHAPCSRRIWPGSGIIYAVVKTKPIDRIAHE